MSKLIQRPPVDTILLDYASTNVTTSAYVEVVHALSQPATAVEIFNGSGSLLKLATGISGQEVDLPYTILPGGSNIFLPISVGKGVRIAVKAINQTADIGDLVLNFFS